jgi:hypothetical protein
MKRKLAFLMSLLAFTCNAHAYDWMTKGHVTDLEPTYIPGFVVFQLDVPEGNQTCAIVWDGSSAQGTSTNKQVDNVKAVYAMLLSAKSTGQSVVVYGSNPAAGSTTCTGNYIHLVSS